MQVGNRVRAFGAGTGMDSRSPDGGGSVSHEPTETEREDAKIDAAIDAGFLCEGCCKSPYEPNNDCLFSHPTDDESDEEKSDEGESA